MEVELTFERLLIREEEINVSSMAALTEHARNRAKTMKDNEFDSHKNKVTALVDGLPIILEVD
jgi:hypothetical protein